MSIDVEKSIGFREEWFENASFTTDWASRAFKDWHNHLASLRDRQLDILEIGAWEGRSTLFWLNYFLNSRVTCIDIFTLGNEGLFDENVLKRYAHRVRKMATRSIPVLDQFAVREKRAFDLIYIDGSHERDDVMLDTLLSWRILKVGGILIWDDYDIFNAMSGHFTKDQDPKPAIDAFLSWKEGEYEILHKDYQVIVKKTKPHYETIMSSMDPNLSTRDRPVGSGIVI